MPYPSLLLEQKAIRIRKSLALIAHWTMDNYSGLNLELVPEDQGLQLEAVINDAVEESQNMQLETFISPDTPEESQNLQLETFITEPSEESQSLQLEAVIDPDGVTT